MGFEEGHKKLGGRKAGTRNKNSEIRERFRDFVLENFDGFQEDFKKLSLEDRCKIFLKSSEFVVPKVSSVKFEDEGTANSAAQLLKAAAEYK